MKNLKLPEGWTIEAYYASSDEEVFVINNPQRYMVTVDLDKRCFRGGMTAFGAPANKAGFRGRGWRQALVDAACAWLTEAVK